MFELVKLKLNPVNNRLIAPNEDETTKNLKNLANDLAESPSFLSGRAGKQRRKKTRYYKRKSKQFKKKTMRKNSNGPCIQTTEMMLSSYLNNNSKPIIKGYSIQKKFMPDKKLISIHTNIISNKSIRKTKKKNKRRTKKLKK